MSKESPNLDQIQRWMQTVISWPGGVEAGIASEAAQENIPLANNELESIVTASSRQTSLERIGIYANAYYARLLECLSEEFPSLVSAMGQTAFGAFSMEYLQKYPPTSYTLCDLGAHFPQFLRENKPKSEENEVDWTDLLIEVATLERVYSEVFDGPGIEQTALLTAEALNSIKPEEWPEISLKMAPCFRLMQFQFPVHEFISSARKGDTPQIPEQQLTYLAITRRNYIVRREVISPAEYFLLSMLQQGSSVGDAITLFAESDLMEPEELGIKLHEWFQHWTTAAFFIDVCKP
ncbi:MAG: DNA-binding domain-containing protein [Gimesia sp.]